MPHLIRKFILAILLATTVAMASGCTIPVTVECGGLEGCVIT